MWMIGRRYIYTIFWDGEDEQHAIDTWTRFPYLFLRTSFRACISAAVQSSPNRIKCEPSVRIASHIRSFVALGTTIIASTPNCLAQYDTARAAFAPDPHTNWILVPRVCTACKQNAPIPLFVYKLSVTYTLRRHPPHFDRA